MLKLNLSLLKSLVSIYFGVLALEQETCIEVTFRHYIGPQDDETFFAFTFPWSYTEDQELLDNYETELKDDSDIYFHRELLVMTKEERRVEVVTISSRLFITDKREKLTIGLFPEADSKPRAFMFEKKKYVMISARVHPGELPSSHVYRGIINFLLNKSDPRAKAIRDNFVFVFIPILNPDGVYRGHYRSDINGANLNRYYLNPNLNDHPSIFGAKQIVADLASNDRLYLYCDLHAHATKKGCFIFGNNLEFRQQVLSRIFPKLLSINSEYFEYDSCCFSEKNLLSKEKGDGKDKEGAGRVALYKMTGLINCYTLECNYNSGKSKNVLTEPKRQNTSSSKEEGNSK
jgi:cytosolic carboxypeptidase protein 5